MTGHRDPLERAFALLREQHGAELPPVGLEARLRGLFARRRRRSPLLLAGAALLLGGAAVAAPSAVTWLRSWWFAIEVDGQRVDGVVAGPGERSFTFATVDGGTAEVRVRRDVTADGAARTRIAVDREAPGRHERDRIEDVVQRRPMAVAERLPLTAIEGCTPIHQHVDAAGGGYAVYVVADGAGGSRVLVHHLGAGERPVESIARVPLPLLRDGSRAEISERADGSLLLTFADRSGASFEFAWAGDGPPRAGGSELTTPDGKVRVRVDDLPDSHRR